MKTLMLFILAAASLVADPSALTPTDAYAPTAPRQRPDESLDAYRDRVNRAFHEWEVWNKSRPEAPREIRKVVAQGKKIHLFWSRPVMVGDEDLRNYPALLIEAGGALWIYSLERGTLQLTGSPEETAAAKLDPTPYLARHDIVLRKLYELTDTYRKQGVSTADETNDCFIQTLQRYVELKRQKVELRTAAIYCFWYEYGREKYGHAVLTVQANDGHNYYHDVLFGGTIPLATEGDPTDPAVSPTLLGEIVRLRATQPDVVIPEGSIVAVYKTVPVEGGAPDGLAAYRLDHPVQVKFAKTKLGSLAFQF